MASEQDTEDYTVLLQERLQGLTVPDSLHCQDPLCDDESHSGDCDSLLLDVLCSLVETCYTVIRLSGGGKVRTAYFSAQTVGVKLAWGVPRATRTYLLQQCLAPGTTSARAEVLARFTGFYSGLQNSPSPEAPTSGSWRRPPGCPSGAARPPRSGWLSNRTSWCRSPRPTCGGYPTSGGCWSNGSCTTTVGSNRRKP